MSIGARCYFNRNCSITATKNVKIGSECFFANNIVIVDHNHKIVNGSITRELESASVVIEDNVWIGANSTILSGVHIGTGCIVGAGAVVTKDIPAHTIVCGVPAKEKKYIITGK